MTSFSQDLPILTTRAPQPTAVLVGVQFPNVSDSDHQGSLDELARLATTLGYRCVGRLSQRRPSHRGATVLGEGALKRLAAWTGGTGVVPSGAFRKKNKAQLKAGVAGESDGRDEVDPLDEPEESGVDGLTPGTDASLQEMDPTSDEPIGKADVVIFDCELTPSQLRNLEKATGAEVLDRTGVVIGIFSRHAKTREAKIQVELAQLAYVSPRLRETGGGERQGGGIGAKGSGETSLELDRRKIRDRQKELRTELEAVGREQSTRRTRRLSEPTVALVGYTNAGKSSLMRALTGSEVLVADQLFATLDTTVRPMVPDAYPRVLISDTVGFIKNLPHDLVASFRSTLEEASQASLQLLVVDGADLAFRNQKQVVETVLAEVGAGDIPRLLILNKRDRLDDETQQALSREFPGAILLSTRSRDDLKSLRETLVAFFLKDLNTYQVFAPYDTPGFIGEMHSAFKVTGETYGEQGPTFQIKGSAEAVERLQKKYGALGLKVDHLP